jgi:hypothetical protein
MIRLRPVLLCQTLANLKAFCQGLAKCIPRAANGFANVWQNRSLFAEHWQNQNGRNKLRPSPRMEEAG